MTTLDRYVIHQFLRIYLMAFVCLWGLFIMGELVTNFSEFVTFRENTANFRSAITAYYAARIPMFFDIAGPIIALISLAMVMAWMHRHEELTALQAAGVKPIRMATPLVVLCVLATILGAANREFGLPRLRQLLVNDIRDMVKNPTESLASRFDHRTEILFDGEQVSAETSEIINIELRLPWQFGKVHTLRAERASFHPANGSLPSGYLLHGVETPLGNVPSLWSDDNATPLILAPHDTEWLGPDQLYVYSELSPNILCTNSRYRQYSSTPELLASLRADGQHAVNAQVTLHSRFLRPFQDLLLISLGLPIMLAAQRRSLFASAAKTMLVVTVFSLITICFQGMGTQAMVSPALAAWGPLMVLGPVAVLMSGPMLR